MTLDLRHWTCDIGLRTPDSGLGTRDFAMTLLYTDPLFLKHDTGRHPETSERLRAITARLEKSGLVKKCTAGTYKPLSEETVARVHSPMQIMRAKQLAEHGGGRADADTVLSAESFQVALAAAGAC